MADEYCHKDNISFAEANAWFFRLQAEDATDADREGFAQWLTASTRHANAWAEVQALLTALNAPGRVVYDALRAKGDSPFNQTGESVAVSGAWQLPRKRPLMRSAVLVMAVLLLLLASLQAPVYYDRLTADHATVTGERSAVTLADGSVVELNTDTAIRTDFANGHRRVELLRGEAYFVVKPDATRPFAVAQGQGEVRVIGTQFSVSGQDDRTVVRVAEGVVNVTANAATGKALHLRSGQAVDYSEDGIFAVRTVDPLAAFAWRRGQVVFRQQPLSEVVAELNRYWPGWVVILDAAIADRIVSGVFDIDRRASVLDALQQRLDVRVTTLSPYFVLLY